MRRPLLWAFAVEDTSVQLSWRALPSRRATVGVGPVGVAVHAPSPAWIHRPGRRSLRLSDLPAGPGAVVVDGLEPGRTYDVWLEPDDGARQVVGRVTTLRPPPGPELCRVATISDLHVGERRFGMFNGIADVHPNAAGVEPYPLRCAQAALEEARAWGAEVVIVKGDLTGRSRPDEFRAVGRLLASSGMTPLVLLGNHDVRQRADLETLLPGIAVARAGRPLARDLPGIRLVLGHSAVATSRGGHVDDAGIAAIVDAVAAADRPVLLSLHHAPERWALPTFYPPGIDHAESRRLLAGVAAANPATVLVAGHSHRNRTYKVRGQLVAEVGSTKDFPGAWAGYAVHEGGMRQVVRRIARPDVIAWTEATAAAIGGVWGRWAPGQLADRCWTIAWPPR